MNPNKKLGTFLRVVIGFAIGGGFGFAAYYFIGCHTGSCPFIANPFISVGIFGSAGILLATSAGAGT